MRCSSFNFSIISSRLISPSKTHTKRWGNTALSCGIHSSFALTGMFKGIPLPADKVTPEMCDLAGRMIENPDESWWVALHAIEALGRGAPALMYRNRLLEFLDYDCTCLQTADGIRP